MIFRIAFIACLCYIHLIIISVVVDALAERRAHHCETFIMCFRAIDARLMWDGMGFRRLLWKITRRKTITSGTRTGDDGIS